MADIVSQYARSKMMAGIKSKNTRPELVLRKMLHRIGFRYRIHDGRLPGKPDLVFPKYHAVVFVHGCFWHGHSCPLFKWPSSNEMFWERKIRNNKRRDELNKFVLNESGWRIGIVWECALKKSGYSGKEVVQKLVEWLGSESAYLEIGK